MPGGIVVAFILMGYTLNHSINFLTVNFILWIHKNIKALPTHSTSPPRKIILKIKIWSLYLRVWNLRLLCWVRFWKSRIRSRCGNISHWRSAHRIIQTLRNANQSVSYFLAKSSMLAVSPRENKWQLGLQQRQLLQFLKHQSQASNLSLDIGKSAHAKRISAVRNIVFVFPRDQFVPKNAHAWAAKTPSKTKVWRKINNSLYQHQWNQEAVTAATPIAKKDTAYAENQG